MKTLKFKIYSLILFGGLFTFTSCTKNIICISPNGEEITEKKSISEIDKISHDFDGNLVIHQVKDIKEPYLQISGSSNMVKNLKTRRRGSSLILENNRCTKKSSDLVVDIYVSVLDEIDLNGSGNITSVDTLLAKKIELSIAGSGAMDFDLKTTSLEVDISGSGDIYLAGNSKNANYSISGSGSIDSYDFNVEEADVKISGSGTVKAAVSSYLKVNISGSGNVYYLGSPSISQKVSGSGSIFKL